MSFRFAAAVIALYMIFFPVPVTATSGVGTTAGKFSVTNNGAAQYTVPIQVPPGINGMEPRIALVYNSQKGNGLVGVGWSLSGLDSVRRCAGSIAIDGARSGISYSAERFCFNGQRLIEVARETTSGSEYREYHTELESFARIRAYGADAANPAYFQVWTTEGRTLILGSTSNSNFKPQQATNGNTLAWAVNRIEDRSGNYMTVTYYQDSVTGEHRVTKIDYTGNGSEAPVRQVAFDYQSRTDDINKYVAGTLLTTSQRLWRIETKFLGSTVRTYTLNYDQENSGASRSRLRFVDECGSDGVCFSTPLSFGWRNAGTTGFDPDQTVSVAGGDEFGQWNRLVDMNGDGFQDVFSVTSPSAGTVEVKLGQEGGGYTAGPSTSGIITDSANGFNEWNELADLDGDGIVDIFRVIIPGSGSVADAEVYLGQTDGTFNKPAIPLPGVVAYDPKGFRYKNQLIDMNGDGRMDLFSATGQNADIRYGSASGAYSLGAAVQKTSILSPYDTAGDEGFRETNQLVDANGDGLIDVIRKSSDQVLISMAQADGSFTATTPQSGVLAPSGTWGGYANYINYLNQFVDVNGDGALDVVRLEALNPKPIDPSSGDYGVLGASNDTTQTTYQWNNDHTFIVATHIYHITHNYYSDEMVAASTLKVWLGDGAGKFYEQSVNATINMGNLSLVPTGSITQCANSNLITDDTDVDSGTSTYTYYQTENNWDCTAENYAVSDTSFKGFSHLNQFADMDGDGMVDLVRVNESTGAVSIAYGDGQGGFQSSVATGLSLGGDLSNGFRAYNRLSDLDGDGITDILDVNGTTGAPQISKREALGKIEDIINGLGLTTSIQYKPITDSSVYTQSADTTIDVFPVRKVRLPMLVVSDYTQTDGANFNYQFDMTYQDARIDLHRGWLGFAQVTRIDKRAMPNIETVTTYRQAFPFTGRAQEVARKLSGQGTFEQDTSTWGSRLESGGGTPGNLSDDVYFVYRTQNIRSAYDINNGYAPVLQETTDYLDGSGDSEPYDNYGSPERVRTTYIDGHEILTDTTNAYNETASLYPGQLSTQTVETTHTTPPGSPRTRKTQRTFYAGDGLLNTEQSQPDTGDEGNTLSLTTSYTYDTYGHIAGKTASGLDAEYDSNGAQTGGSLANRAESYTHASMHSAEWVMTKASEGLTEEYKYSGPFGGQTSYKDPNGISTTWSYDGFGRQQSEVKYAAGAPITTTTEYSATCTGGVACAAGVRQEVKTTTSSGALSLSPGYTQLDALGRELRVVSEGAAGEKIYVDTEYDAEGRIDRKSLPYSTTPQWTEMTYDDIGRETNRLFPNGMNVDYAYLGLTTTVTRTTSDEPDQVTVYTQDSQGQIVSVKDALLNTTNYDYGPFGVLEQITGPDSAVYGFTYDIYGNKTEQDDPDMGAWSYRYNAFGELKWQKDAKNQIITTQYDPLGRRTGRTEGAGGTPVTTTWTYDTAPGKGLGKLGQVTRTANGGTSESYVYDSLGRVASTTTTVDGASYAVTTTYDGLDRPETVTYPDNGLKIRYGYYTNGALEKVIDDGDPALIYWKADTYNAFGQVTDETWGNGATGSRSYDPLTGRLTGITTGAGIQNLAYTYYKSGNLRTRTDHLLETSGVTETFSYDVLDRLTSVISTLPVAVTQNYEYYPNGNIKSKTGVGTYSYDDPGHPHAVTGVDNNLVGSPYAATDVSGVIQDILNGTTAAPDCNGDSVRDTRDVTCINNYLPKDYGYDANGNMESGDGRNVTYTLFNKPSVIEASGNTATMEYDFDFNRVTKTVQKRTTQTRTTYIGKLYEKIEITDGAGSRTEEHFYISAAGRLVAKVREEDDTPIPPHYIHTDLLGSVDVITDENQAVIERFSFDAFGMPRKPDQTNGAPLPPQLTTRGYTGHEMDDESGLINMNARLYDPKLGRFMTPDTVIPDVYNPQSLNRYSYVLNNPFRYTDPAGYAPIENPFDVTFSEFLGATDQEWADSLDSLFLSDFDTVSDFGGSDFGLLDYTGVGEEFDQLAMWIIDPVEAIEEQSALLISQSSMGCFGNSSGMCHTADLVFTDKGYVDRYQPTVGDVVVDTIFGGSSEQQYYAKYTDFTKSPEPGLGQVSFGPIELAFSGPQVITTKVITESVLENVASKGIGFNSARALRSSMAPGAGEQIHHIVEQTPSNIAKFGPQAIHNTANAVPIPYALHQGKGSISAYYSSKVPAISGEQTIRRWLSSQSYDAQYEFGLRSLRDFGVLP